MAGRGRAGLVDLLGVVLDGDGRVAGDVLLDPAVGADADVVADGDGPEELGAAADDDVAAERGVALVVLLERAGGGVVGKVERADGDALVQTGTTRRGRRSRR